MDGELEDEELLLAWLEDKRGKKVSLIHPQKGEHLSIVQLCIKNANEHLAQNAGRLGREFAALEELAQLLGLPQAPEYIESYDISHTFGADNVAGMVVFHNGRPMKKAYKNLPLKALTAKMMWGQCRRYYSGVLPITGRTRRTVPLRSCRI